MRNFLLGVEFAVGIQSGNAHFQGTLNCALVTRRQFRLIADGGRHYVNQRILFRFFQSMLQIEGIVLALTAASFGFSCKPSAIRETASAAVSS